MGFWEKIKLGKYNSKELREHLGLSPEEFNRLMDFESERYKKMITGKYGKDFWESKIKENPNAEKYGNTPIFPPHPRKTPSYIFNEESGVYLEKMWSNKNKHNTGKDLPFDFIFKA